MIKVISAKKLIIQVLVCLLILLAVMFLCASKGTQQISLQKAFAGLETGEKNIDYEIFFRVRLPRVILAALVGAALACSGAVLQAILRNPLADPYILGISSGAGLGVMIAVVTGVSWGFLGGGPVAIFAFTGALITVWLVWYVGRTAGKTQTTALLLAGVVINAFFSALIMFITSIARGHQIRSTIYWLMGNITEKEPTVLWVSGFCIIAGIAALCGIGQKLNAMTLGKAEAQGLGIDTEQTKLISFGISAFITSVAVGLSGLIGFVGLIVPHSVRLVCGPDHRRLLVLSAVSGAGFVVLADTLSRTILPNEQLPVGVITAIAGGPFFLILLAGYSRKISWLK